MRQKYHFATDNGILIWDVTSILEDIEQHPDSYTIQTLSTALLADHNDARVSHTRAMASDLTKPLVLSLTQKPFRASFPLFQSRNGSFYFISFLSISQYVRPCCLSENLPHPM